MSKKTRNRPARAVEGPNPKQPCPCGSGKRYKACHGAGDDVIVLRPFAGLTAEPDLVALREFVPSATAPLALAEPGERRVSLASVLPGAAAAMVRPNGEALVGMQVQTRGGDISTDLGRALRWALRADPGSVLPVAGPGLDAEAGAGPVRLQDLLVAEAELPVSLHADFGWWLPEGEEPTTEGAAALEHANKAIMRTELLSAEGVRSAYWVDTGTKAHLRWVRPEPEDRLVGALARLAARDELHLGEGSRYAGSFRAHGLLVPVWDLDREPHVKEWAEPAQAFAKRLAEALARDTPLTDTERRARESLAGRQVTLR
jgi:hypothetical protein